MANGLVADHMAVASKSLSIGLKRSKVQDGSLRLLAKLCWQEGLSRAGFIVGDAVDSTAVEVPMAKSGKKGTQKRMVTRGATAFLMNNASLSVTDTAVRLQWTSDASVSDVLHGVMTVILPSWETKCPDEYLKYLVFSQTALAEEQARAGSCWLAEICKLRDLFDGVTVTLGSERTVTQRLFVANYQKPEEVLDFFSIQVVASDLRHGELFQLAPGAKSLPPGPVRKQWKDLHLPEPRCPSSKAQIVESYSTSYSCNAAYGSHVTSCVSTAADEGTRKITLASSMPMTKAARKQFVSAAQSMGQAKSMVVTEFSLSPLLFNAADAPDLEGGFKLVQSSRHVGPGFACSFHYFVQDHAAAKVPKAKMHSEGIFPANTLEAEDSPVLVEVQLEADAATAGAQLCLGDMALSDLPVALMDVGALKRRADLWAAELPRVSPHYAVKCNSSTGIVSALWRYWNERAEAGLTGAPGGFDCASPTEMDVVKHLPNFDMGKNVIYANPCKHGSAVRYAKEVGVRRIVFDNLQELEKMKQLYPDAELVLRVQTDDSLAQCPLSNKFGAPVADCGALLDRALELELAVVGVSFHVGSGCSEVGAYRSALHRARAVFDEAESRGLSLSLLDIGGGFPGCDVEGEPTFSEHAADIREMLEKYFPDPDLKVIAEPGRFFAATAQAVLATVLSVADSPQGFRYYLNDGVYGSFNCLIYDHAEVIMPEIFRDGCLKESGTLGACSRCTLFGPTCDGFDMISDKLELPALKCGDKLLFRNMGAYTSSASSSFNGFAPASSFTFESLLADGC